MRQSTIDRMMRFEDFDRPGQLVDEVEDYIAAQVGKTWRESEYADIPCPRLTPCRCGVLMARTNSELCDMCQTPAVLYVTRTGEYDTANTPRRNDTTPLIILCVLVLLCTAIVANSMQGAPLGRGRTTMEAS